MTPHEFVQDYEFVSEAGSYTPSDAQRAMIEDAIEGFLAADEADLERRIDDALTDFYFAIDHPFGSDDLPDLTQRILKAIRSNQ